MPGTWLPVCWGRSTGGMSAVSNHGRADVSACPVSAVADEVIRLEKLGATVMERHQHDTVMQDPEGNEFCVEPGPAPLQD